MSFNPYFNGSCSYTKIYLKYIILLKRVSILILMEVALTQDTFIGFDLEETPFQSLF